MKVRYIISAAAVSFLLTGCGLYNKYEQKTPVPDNVFGTSQDIQKATGETSIAQVSWREFFTDPMLQELIDSVLSRNTDLNSARIAVEKSQAALKAAKLAYLPSLYFAPQGSISSFDNSPAVKAYNLPLQLSMDIDVFGSITNKKRAAKAVLLQSQMYQEAVRANLVSATAQQYFMLQVLDRQLDILTQTDELWHKSLETEKALWENGKAYSTAVNQQESSYLSVKTQIVDTQREILAVENELCEILAITPQHIERSRWENDTFQLSVFNFPISAEALLNRPDIRAAEFGLEQAFYNTQTAKAAFFPTVTLSGAAGWTNNNGIVVDPGKLLLTAIASLTQPIFNRGKIKGNYDITKLTEENTKKKFVQTVIEAGNDVNEALADRKASHDKYGYYHRQVEVLKEAYTGTHELMDAGKASYLEVLKAQESLLDAQLNEVINLYNGAVSVIALYISLGGGTK
jgi:NodT family efflux transporter outer membrane factor (OMF) lipoprotein